MISRISLSSVRFLFMSILLLIRVVIFCHYDCHYMFLCLRRIIISLLMFRFIVGIPLRLFLLRCLPCPRSVSSFFRVRIVCVTFTRCC